MLLDCRPRFVFSVTDVFERTFGTLWIASDTDGASVMDYLVREKDPVVVGDDFHQVLLDSRRIVVLGQFEPARNAMNVGVDDDAISDSEPGAEYDIGCLSRSAGNAEQFVHGLGDYATKSLDDRLSSPYDGFRFVAEETG